MNTIKLDINEYLKDKTFNIDNITYKGIRVLDMNKNQLINICKDYNFTNLLTTSNQQLKLSKNKKELNIYTIGIMFLPFTLFNKEFDITKIDKDIIKFICKKNNIPFNVIANYKIVLDLCSNSTKDCRINCIKFTGKGMFNNVEKARLHRKELLLNDIKLFFAMYIRYNELELIYCLKNKLLLTNRFNILSDINIESFNVIYKDKKVNFAKLLNNFSKNSITNEIDFNLIPYDYTKDYNRKELDFYKLVYSINGFDNDKTLIALKNKMSFAMVLDIEDINKPLPKTYKINGIDIKMIDGDLHDYLPLQKEQVIFGLRWKVNRKDNIKTRIAKKNKAILNGFCRIA